MAALMFGLVLFANMVAAKCPNTTYWHTLQTFTYSALPLNVTAAMISLAVTKMCCDFTVAAVLSRRKRHSPQATNEDQYTLLESFGMSPGFKQVVRINNSILVIAVVYNITAVCLWAPVFIGNWAQEWR